MHTPTISRMPLAIAGLGAAALLTAGIGVSAAAFTDYAQANLGVSGTVGDPDRFDIAVDDKDGALQDAATPAEAVVLPLADGTELSEDTPIEFAAKFTNRNPGINGHLTFGVYDPDKTDADDIFNNLLFTMYIGNSATAVLSDVSAADLNAAAKGVDLDCGDAVKVRLKVVLAKGTGEKSSGKSTEIGMYAEGESR